MATAMAERKFESKLRAGFLIDLINIDASISQILVDLVLFIVAALE